ncbi:mechanosensitive ion channel [Inquilinus limosus]|uniref:mechanosensitive ion channel domain-containing protein n=1 Tax=Inquilinus limosus TaxID=171674 RepID=UPI003F14193A
MTLSVLAFVFGIPIGTLVATSGVIAIILGLALQNTLGDVLSGIAMTLGRPFGIGDWIVLSDGTEGRVVGSMGEACTLEALTRVTVYEIDQIAFGPLIENRPALAEDLALSLSARVEKARASPGEGLMHGRSLHFFLGAIQTVFRRRSAG